MNVDSVLLEQEKVIYDNFTALDNLSTLAVNMESLFIAHKTIPNVDPVITTVAMNSLYISNNISIPSNVAMEGFISRLKQIWTGIVNIIISIKNAILNWLKTLLSKVVNIKDRCISLVKDMDKYSNTVKEDYTGSKFDSSGSIRFKSITVDLKEPDGFLYKGEIVGLNEDGINGVRTAINNNVMNSVIMDKGNDICELLRTSSIREKDDYIEFKREFNALITEFNDGVMSRTNICGDYSNEPVYEIRLPNYPANGKYIITKEADNVPVTVDFIGGGDIGKGNGSYKAPAMTHEATKSFALLVGATCGDIINAQRELNKVTALDDKVINAGKQLLNRMNEEVYDDTDYQSDMTANFNTLNKLGSSSRKAYVGLIRNSTRVLSGAYLYAADCYRNLVL